VSPAAASRPREAREHEVRPPGAWQLDGAPVDLDGQLAEQADPHHVPNVVAEPTTRPGLVVVAHDGGLTVH
jgi:hypothetical protein